MSDEGEKTCPLCAEEMDLTDQQLRPCRCGYDICVWCWHHIMDMAEKDDTEGRCPACRTPYNKEKIVGTASKCERLVAEMSVEKKQKSQKGKTKTSEGRKQLSTVRVIQRNLVYIVGLPLNLADEDILQRKEYFGQYGKVLKVSISRTAAGSIQHFANNTCSVYITYSKEDEAVRSIQSVHGFVLDGRPLRACFGTTKYCHAWLRNMPCTNPDCLYLHEFGSQEDSFTKDEIISEYTRGRVQQVTGNAINDMQRRSGNILPPAADDYSNNTTCSWAKPISKATTNDTSNSMKGSPPNSSSGRSVAALPAAASWGTHASNNQSLAVNIVSSNGGSKQTAVSVSSTAVVSPSSHVNEIPKNHSEESPTANGKSKLHHPESATSTINTHLSTPSPNDKSKPNFSRSEIYRQSSDIAPDEDLDASDDGGIQKLSSDMSSLGLGRNLGLQPCEDENLVESFSSEMAANPTIDKVQQVAYSESETDLLSFNDQRLRDPEVVTHTSYAQSIPQSSHLGYSPPFGNQNHERGSLLNTLNMPVANGHSSNGHSYFSGNGGSRKQMGIYDDTAKRDSSCLDLVGGENSIISNILSMEFDPWDESLTSPQSLAKLLGNSDKQVSQSSSRKTQNSNQSRFSFAREEDGGDQGSNFTPNLSDFVHVNGFSSFNFEESAAHHSSSMSSNKISSTSRSQISAPPGFMGPSRAPPPGFTHNERIEQQTGNHMFDTGSLLRKAHQAVAPVYNNGVGELELMDPAILAIGGSRVDMRSSNFPSQHASYENDNRIRLLMQRSFTQQNQRYTADVGGDSYPPRSRILEQVLPNNRSGYQLQGSSFQQQPRMSNGHWEGGWNEVQSGNGNGHDIAMAAELLRNERVGYNKYYTGYEDTKFRMPSSADLYNRTYGRI